MSVGDVAPWHWGDLHRYVLQQIEGRRDIDAEARAQIEHAHDIGLHWDPPLSDYSHRSDMCRLCGDVSFSSVVRANRRGREVDFLVDDGGEMRSRPRPDGLLCWKCLYSHVDHLDPGLALMRRVLLSAPDGARFLPTLRKVEEARRFRNVTGTCELCGRRGAAIQGPTGVVYCLFCYRAAQTVRDAEMARWAENRRRREERFDDDITSYMRAMWAVARDDAQGAFDTMVRRGEIDPPPSSPALGATADSPPASVPDPADLLTFGARLARAVSKKLEKSPLISQAKAIWDGRPARVSLGWTLLDRENKAPPGDASDPGAPRTPDTTGGPAPKPHADGRPPIPPVVTTRDSQAKQAIEFLDAEVPRALKHTTRSHDLMGDAVGIRNVHSALRPRELSPAMLLRLLCSVSMLRQVMETGSSFCGYTGDELINERMGDYDAMATWLDIGVHGYAKAASEGGVIVHGGTREQRARVAAALRRISDHRTADAMFSRPSAPFQYVEAEDFYAMTPEAQEEVRRRMLITPPYVTVFGADDLDRFVEETPRRATARVVTYLFMNGHDHIDLGRGDVHVSPPPPALPRPTDA